MTTPVDPSRTALMVMDFQPAIVANLPDAAALLAKTAGAIAQARAAGAKIVYVRVAFTAQDYAAVSPRNKSFAALAGGGFLDDASPESGIHPDLVPEDGDIVVTKNRVGAFSTTKLAHILNAHDIDTLVLTGISTSGVVLSTLRDAADHDYRLLVLADCCADPDPEVHRVLVEKVFPRQADVVGTAALPAILGR
ncbi:isochorismatase family cysteine hydrolase [Amycolatopsis sp.]|jgi:nicotinamidase-related amidase|uniref:cysteine hydrolase family protein n=1 Tax=Amycolatopsis sp. TaxID=37632 RepID=UPI002E01C908|nr:isochorismatase family cysteine hydrolase [Amycolatopsis sp.]